MTSLYWDGPMDPSFHFERPWLHYCTLVGGRFRLGCLLLTTNQFWFYAFVLLYEGLDFILSNLTKVKIFHILIDTISVIFGLKVTYPTRCQTQNYEAFIQRNKQHHRICIQLIELYAQIFHPYIILFLIYLFGITYSLQLVFGTNLITAT